jgi:hypothetical protein
MKLETSVVVALIAAAVTAAGWLVNHILADRRAGERQQTEACLQYVERQLEQLYGPLVSLIYERRRTFIDLCDTLGRNQVFVEGQPLTEDELEAWLFWSEESFLPTNERIKQLLMSKTHLIEGEGFPQSYVALLDHCNSWNIRHKRWKEQGVEYSWHSKINWPLAFQQEVIETFQRLKARYTALLGQLTSTNDAPTPSSPELGDS